jgi:HK97 gp10 family phage protein
MIDQKQVLQLTRMLNTLPKKIRNKILREELRRSAKELVAPSKAATPVKTGRLRKSVKVRAKRSRKAVQFTVGFNDKNFQGDTFYGAFLEFGWKAGKRNKGNTRKQIPAKRILGKVAESNGPRLIDSAINRIGDRVLQEARNG